VPFSLGQTEAATLSGLVTDPQGKVVPGVAVEVTNVDTNVSMHQITNGAGLYVAVGLKPGRYRVSVTKDGFRRIDLTDLVLNVQDVLSRNFQLQLGPVMASITVVADEAKVNTESATVSTVVDRHFAENLPMNGRSFQTLIELTPGVILTASNLFDSGQFSVNGQRTDSNYWMVDGVSANIGIGTGVGPGTGLGGSVGSFSALGGTNSLVSVDALQEFRIQTSTYAPEFGRTPGGQISIVTRSGTNQFHGTAFDYLRNDVLDANNWFADSAGLPKPQERQNDFGGTFGGPILKDRTFFFFSYEGLRLRLPQTSLTTVPDASFTPGGTTNSRQNAIPALQPYLNAYPLPNRNSPEILCDPNTDPFCPSSGKTGSADFNASYSNPATLDAYSLRLDHKLNNRVSLFGRYDYSPSEIVLRGGGMPLNELFSNRITTQTATLGATFLVAPTIANDLRVNYSRTNGSSSWHLDDFGAAVPLTSLPLPSPYTSDNGQFALLIYSLTNGEYLVGQSSRNVQRQFNIVDNLSLQTGPHSLKFGIDYRRLSPIYAPVLYDQAVSFSSVSTAGNGNADFGAFTISEINTTFSFQNIGAFAQDTWRVIPRLTLTYGLRWDVDIAPSTTNGPAIPAVTGYNLNNLSNLALAPTGTPAFKTTYGNIAPRMGLAYELSKKQGRETVLRGGVGVFYDLADGQLGNLLGSLDSYPFGGFNFFPTATFPLDPGTAAPPAITPANLGPPFGALGAFDPHLKLPYTLEWNIALEQSLGSQQALSVSYVGAAGRRLIQSALITSPNPTSPTPFGSAYLVGNSATSDYDALQVQFKRRLEHGLQVLASYSWSHSLDDASAGSEFGNAANGFVSGLGSLVNRGPSDFDLRHTFSAGLTYSLPALSFNPSAKAILGGWELENVIQARSALPLNVFEAAIPQLNQFSAQVRPDVVSGQAVYLSASQCIAVLGPPCAGGRGLNPAAFVPPPLDTNGNPLRQGDLGRNALRSFGAAQWDFAVHRNFPIHEQLKLQFRAELFNVLNRPNFGPLNGGIGRGGFGQASQTLSQSLGGNVGNGGFSSLYQLGGPRSVQLALKLMF